MSPTRDRRGELKTAQETPDRPVLAGESTVPAFDVFESQMLTLPTPS